MRFRKAETLFVEGEDDDDARDENVADARRRRPPPPPPRQQQPSPSPDFAPEIDASNPGYSMLRSMGWSEANPGLGKRGRGRSEPVRAEPRRARAGLGVEKRGEKQPAAAAPPRRREEQPTSSHSRGKRKKQQQENDADPSPAPVDPAVAAARQRGAALVAELLSRDLGGFGQGGSGSVDASQRALNPLLDAEGAPTRRHRRRNPLLACEEEGDVK